MGMAPDAVAGVVATVLMASTATAYAPTDPRFGVIVIPDETWLGREAVEYLRIDGLASHGYVTSIELHTTAATYTNDDTEPIGVIAERIRTAINNVIAA